MFLVIEKGKRDAHVNGRKMRLGSQRGERAPPPDNRQGNAASARARSCAECGREDYEGNVQVTGFQRGAALPSQLHHDCPCSQQARRMATSGDGHQINCCSPVWTACIAAPTPGARENAPTRNPYGAQLRRRSFSDCLPYVNFSKGSARSDCMETSDRAMAHAAPSSVNVSL